MYKKELKKMGMCIFCGSPLCWQSDFTYDDYSMDGEGLVSNWSCTNYDCQAEITGFLPDLEE